VAKINVGRVILGGIIAGIVCFLGDGVVHGVLLKERWAEVMTALGPERRWRRWQPASAVFHRLRPAQGTDRGLDLRGDTPAFRRRTRNRFGRRDCSVAVGDPDPHGRIAPDGIIRRQVRDTLVVIRVCSDSDWYTDRRMDLPRRVRIT
jgi:hypothetical protein